MKYIYLSVVFAITFTTNAQKINENTNHDVSINSIEREVSQKIDSILKAAYPNHSPGACVLIAKDDKILYSKAFGMSDIELNVKMNTENVFRIASITKQFTSVSILMLVEEGKLNLNDSVYRNTFLIFIEEMKLQYIIY